MKTDPNESAYPSENDIYGGLTKLEYFSGLAMQGMLASSESYGLIDYEKYAKASIILAKALINELNNS